MLDIPAFFVDYFNQQNTTEYEIIFSKLTLRIEMEIEKLPTLL